MPGKLWSEEEKKILADNYQWNPKVYSLLPGRTIQAIQYQASMLKLNKRGRGSIPTLDIQYFDKWTPKMAWILGFFVADGNLFHKLYEDNREQWYITFTQKDREVLEMIADEFGAPHSLIRRQWSKQFRVNRYSITFTSKYMFEKLVSLGLMSNKSLQLQKINVPKKFFSHFLRGYFDGDGCFWWSKDSRGGTPRLTFTGGSRNFLKWIEARTTRYYGFPSGRLRNRKDTNVWNLAYRKDPTLYLMRIMYEDKDESLFLQRKWDNLQDYLNYRGIDLSTYETPEFSNLIKNRITV